MMDSTKGKWRAMAALGFAVALLAAACSSGDSTSTTDSTSSSGSDTTAAGGDGGDAAWEALVEAAQAEGSVVLYHAKADENAKAILDAFQEKYGISGEAVRAPGGPTIQRIEQELAAGTLQGDMILFGDKVYPEKFRDAGELLIPQGPAAEEYTAEEINGGIVTLGLTPLGIVYNTDAVSTPPTDWDDMIEPGLRVGVMDPAASNNWAAIYDLMGTYAGPDFVEQMSQQEPMVGQTSVVMVQSIAAGELDWTPFGFSYNLNQFEGTGAPIDFAYPESGTFVFTQVGFVHEKANHPNAGLLLLDFLMSAEGQEILNGNNEGISPLDDVPGTVQVPDGVELVPVDLSQFTSDDFAAITAEWTSLFAG
jgi:iron(III) transport system substrate-binding protein